MDLKAKTNVTPRGYVVDHKGNGVRFAVSVVNFNPTVHSKVRDLLPGETVLGYRPKNKRSIMELEAPAPESADAITESPSTEGNEETEGKD